jgi:streptogramin lyase
MCNECNDAIPVRRLSPPKEGRSWELRCKVLQIFEMTLVLSASLPGKLRRCLMSIRSSLRGLFRHFGSLAQADKPERSRTRRRPHLVRPQLEVLEEKLLPSAGNLVPTYIVAPTHEIGSHLGGGLLPLSGPPGLSPAQVRHAYGFDQIFFQNGTVPGDGSGQTIAIVDAHDDPSIGNDLAVFDQQFGLSAPPSFVKVGLDANGNPSTTSFPTPDPGWAGEIELDVEWTHAIAPGAKILLVEANSSSGTDLLRAVDYARRQTGVTTVSMSWDGAEFATEATYDSYFTTPAGHAGVTFFGSSGDSGWPALWPAISTHVVAVGGTSLNVDATGNYLGESGWSGSGGSLSSYLPQPSYQQDLVIHDGDNIIPSGGMRAAPDVAYDADPSTGVAAYGAYGFGGWVRVGGTSAGAPQWAALLAIANQGRNLAGLSALDGGTQTLPLLYQLPSTDFHDITSGSNGVYSAGPGYDLVTGRGSPVANLVVRDLVGPSIVTPAHVVAQTPTTATLNVLGADPAGEANLTYTWSVVGTPPAPVSFDVNGSHAAQTTTATFSRAGVYTLEVTATDPANLTASSQVTVVVSQVVNSISVAPATANVTAGATQQFTATALDQFGFGFALQPTFSWSVDGGGLGSVNSLGQYTAPATGTGSATVRASSSTVSGTASVTVLAGPVITITMFPIPTPSSFPVGITAGPDGNLWFTESQPSKIGRITPAGAVTEFQLPPPLPQNDASTRGPSAMTLGPDGNLWFTEAFGPYNSIGRITPIAPFRVAEFVIPTVNSLPLSITSSSDGNLWFTETNAHKIGRINPWTGLITEFSISSAPICIASGADGNLWYTEGGTDKIGRITPAGAITEFLVPTDPYSSCSGITAGADGNLWFSVVGYGIGRINPFTGAVTEFALSAGAVPWGSPTNVAAGPDGSIWFGTTWGSDVVGRVTPGGAITQYVVSTANFNVEGLTTGPDGNLWFTEDPGRIGRIHITVPPTVVTGAHVVAQTPTTATLNVLGADPTGEANLTYTWSVVGTPPAAVSFNANGTHAAQTTTATFSAAGTYTLQVTLTNAANLPATSQATVTVDAMLTSITVAPALVILPDGAIEQFTATALDQFGLALAEQPGVAWSVDAGGLGSIDSSGLYTAPASGTGSATVRASSDSVSGTADVTIVLSSGIREYAVPTPSSLPAGITAGPPGDQGLWFTEFNGNKIGRIATDGSVGEFTIPTPGSLPVGITAGPDGNLWFVEHSANKIGRLSTAGAFAEFTIPTANSGPLYITPGPDGNLWFTEQNSNKIGRVSVTGAFAEFTVPTPNSQPYGITGGPDGKLWFVEHGSNKIGRLTVTGNFAEYTVPTPGAGPVLITAGPDGNLWFTEENSNQVGKVSFTGDFTEFTVPTGNSGPFGIAAGPDNSLWFTEEQGNKIGRIRADGTITEFQLPSANSSPLTIMRGPDDNLWFTEFTGNRVGQLVLDQSLTATGQTITSTAGVNFSAVVASFVDSDPQPGPATSYSAVIDWGDGSQVSTGGISILEGGTFTVVGSHTYDLAGCYTVTVTITDMDAEHDIGGSSTIAFGTITVVA